MLYLSMYISKRLWMLVKPSIRRYRVKPKCVHVIPTYLHTYTYIIQHLSASTPTRHHYQSFLRRNKLLVGQSARHSAIHLTTCSPAHSVTRIPTPSPLLFNLSANKYFRYRAKQSLPNHNNNINCTKAACCYSNDIFGSNLWHFTAENTVPPKRQAGWPSWLRQLHERRMKCVGANYCGGVRTITTETAATAATAKPSNSGGIAHFYDQHDHQIICNCIWHNPNNTQPQSKSKKPCENALYMFAYIFAYVGKLSGIHRPLDAVI